MLVPQTLIQMLTGMTTSDLALTKKAYRQMYGHTLESKLVGDLSGDFQRFMVAMCNVSSMTS